MIDEEGGISEVIQADVTDEESCKNAVAKTVELFGPVHILVNIGTLEAEDSSLLNAHYYVQLASVELSVMLQRSIWKHGSVTFASMSRAWFS